MNITKNRALRCARNGVFGLLAALLVASCGGGGGGAGNPTATSGLSLVAGQIDTLNGTGAGARLTNPTGVAIDSKGNIYVTQPDLHIVRKITPDGVVTVFAGAVGIEGSTDGPATQALFWRPGGISVDGNDNVFIVDGDYRNTRIRKISSDGVVSTVVGNLDSVYSMAVDGTGTIYASTSENKVLKISQGIVTPLVLPPTLVGLFHLAVDTSSNLYLGHNNVIYRLAPNGVLSTLTVFTRQSGAPNPMSALNGLATDLAGNVYASNGMAHYQWGLGGYWDTGNTVIKISPNGLPTTVAGVLGQAGSLDETGALALFKNPKGLAVDPQGNIVVADSYNNTVRRISPSARVTTLAGHAPYTAPVDGTGSAAGFVQITGLASDKLGRIAVVEASAIRPLTQAGAVSTIPALSIPASNPRYSGAAFDAAGNLYTARNEESRISDDSKILKIAPNGSSTSVASGKSFENLALDGLGNIFATISDTYRITKISIDGSESSFPTSVGFLAHTMGTSGDLYGCTGDRVIKITPSGTVSVLAGIAGKSGYTDGSASSALFSYCRGIAVDGSGNVYVAETDNNVIRKITPDGIVSTVAGRFGSSDTVMGALPGGLYRPRHLAFDGDGSLLVTVDEAAVVRIRLP